MAQNAMKGTSLGVDSAGERASITQVPDKTVAIPAQLRRKAKRAPPWVGGGPCERKERDRLSCRLNLCSVHLAGKEAEPRK